MLHGQCENLSSVVALVMLAPTCQSCWFPDLQDFVKLRGPLFHRFLLALVDDSPRVRGLAEYLLGDTLAAKVCLHQREIFSCM